MDRKFLSLFSMHFFYIASHVFGGTLMTFYFLQKGYSPLDIALYFALSFIVSIFVIMGIKSFRSDSSMRIGIILKMAVFLVAAWLFARPLFFLVGIISGFNTIYYWAPLNIQFFKFRKVGKNATHSGLYFLMWPILNTILPTLAGAAAAAHGMVPVLISGAILLIPSLLISSGIKDDERIHFSFKDFVKRTKGVKTILFIQGIWEGVDWVVVPIATYALISSELKYGAFYSYLGVFGIVTFFLMAHISDRLKKRAVFLYPVTIAMALATMLSGLSSSLIEWGFYRGIVSFLVTVFSSFSLALVVDVSHNIADTMISREFFLNFGRALGAAIVAAVVLFSGNINHALVVSGAIMLLHPLFLRLKKDNYHVSV